MTEHPPTQALFSRRRFLRWTLSGAGVVVAGAGGLWAVRDRAPSVEGLRCLTAQEHQTFEAVASAIIPRGGPFPLGASDVGLGKAFDEYLADEPPAIARDLKRALTLVEYGPLVFEGRPTTFSRLDDEARVAHWNGWTASGLLVRRQVSAALRSFVCLVFYDRPEAWPHIGYTGPSLGAG